MKEPDFRLVDARIRDDGGLDRRYLQMKFADPLTKKDFSYQVSLELGAPVDDTLAKLSWFYTGVMKHIREQTV